jgi:hypothetical protein
MILIPVSTFEYHSSRKIRSMVFICSCKSGYNLDYVFITYIGLLSPISERSLYLSCPNRSFTIFMRQPNSDNECAMPFWPDLQKQMDGTTRILLLLFCWKIETGR